jgi:hypothetical protein
MQVKLNPANGDCWNTLAHVLFKKGDYGGASKAIEMAIQSVVGQLCRKAKTKCRCDTNRCFCAHREVHSGTHRTAVGKAKEH